MAAVQKRSGYLTGARAYLGGPIEAADPTIDWRSEPKRVLIEELKIDLFDPHADPKQQCFNELIQAKEAAAWERVETIVRRFVRKDLCIVDRSDFIIACLPKGVPTVGTVHEIISSNNTKKPTLLVCPQGKQYIPSWYFGFIPHKNMFGSWGSLYTYLREVDSGWHVDDDRWAYVYKII